MTKPTILVVEDDADLAREITERAQAFGYEVIHTTSRGDQAVAKARELRPDLILMDIGLEGQMDGIQAAGLIREVRRGNLRLLQANLVGPAGYISMEDGAATGFVQRGIAASPERASVIEMGGATIGSGDSRVTETAVRGLWKAWRSYMSI